MRIIDIVAIDKQGRVVLSRYFKPKTRVYFSMEIDKYNHKAVRVTDSSFNNYVLSSTVDAKGRTIIPSTFRKYLNVDFYGISEEQVSGDYTSVLLHALQ